MEERRVAVYKLAKVEQHGVAVRHGFRSGPCQLKYMKTFNMENVHYELIIVQYVHLSILLLGIGENKCTPLKNMNMTSFFVQLNQLNNFKREFYVLWHQLYDFLEQIDFKFLQKLKLIFFQKISFSAESTSLHGVAHIVCDESIFKMRRLPQFQKIEKLIQVPTKK